MKIIADGRNIEENLKIILNGLNESKPNNKVEIVANMRWGASRLKSKSGKSYKTEVSKSKPNYELLSKILYQINSKSLIITDTYIEKPQKSTENILKKPKPKKWYAVKKAGDITDTIYETWDECKKVVEGHNSIFKSFFSKEEAIYYLDSVNLEEELAKKDFALKMKNNIRYDIKHEIKNTERISKYNALKDTNTLEISLSNEMKDALLKKCKETGLTIDMVVKYALSQYLY